MHIGSWRWWFENRKTGEITVGQFPNWPLFAIGAGWVIRAIAPDGSTIHTLSKLAITLLWVGWALAEALTGVNPWRRSLGVVVLGWQLVTNLASAD